MLNSSKIFKITSKSGFRPYFSFFSNAKEETYYQILGVDPKSPFPEIKKAYFEKVKKYHPDHNPGDTSCEVLVFLSTFRKSSSG